MKVYSRSVLLVVFCFGLISCITTGPTWTPQQRRALQQKTFDTEYRVVFNAIKSILRDDGYVIENQNYDGGLIIGTKDTPVGFLESALTMGDMYARTGTSFMISFDVEKLSEDSTRTRLTINEKTNYYSGAKMGKEVLDPAVYRNIYRALSVELQRRSQ